MARANDAGLLADPYTFLNDPSTYFTDYNMGVDGVFTKLAPIAKVVSRAGVTPERPTLGVLGMALLGKIGVRQRRPG